VAELEQLIALHPFRERLRGQLMLALYHSGRQAEALEAYRAARRVLIEELGIEPGPALKQVERAILAQDLELAPSMAQRPGMHRGAHAGPGSVPAELTSLIGRDREIEQTAELIARHRLVALVGPGGVGKTRVAQRVARTLASGFEHGSWFVDLAALERDGDVAGAVLAALSIPDQPRARALDTVAAELHERQLLLVLDNCEHVLAAAAEVGERLLRDCPGVRLLATTREPLAIVAEHVMRLDPLPTTATGREPPASVTLFLERAASHGVSWPDGVDGLGTIREVCARLDGIPLAIELAAARTRAISPAALLAHLDDRLRLLARPSRGSAPTRQQTLEGAIAWSYDLLSAEDQATLRRLSVFHGGFTLAAAAAVCADIGAELDTLDRVTGLVDRSVMSVQRRSDGERYRLLESIGLFAEQRLQEHGEATPARDRHAGFFVAFVQDASNRPDRRDQASWARLLDAEHDNLTAALSWCLDREGDPTTGAQVAANVGWHWILRGRSNLAKRWLERALGRSEEVPPPTVAAVNVAYSGLAYSISDLDTSRSCATEAIATARVSDDPDLLAEALAQLAIAYQGWGNSADVLAVTTELRSLQPRLTSPRARAMALLACAQVALFTGQPAQAAADASGAREIARDAGDHIRASWSGYWLAQALALRSAISPARAAVAEAIEDAVRSGYELGVVDSLNIAAMLALVDDDPETTRRLLPQAASMLRDQQRWDDLGARLRVAAAAEFRLGLAERSAVLLGAAERWTDHIDVEDALLLPELAELRDRLNASLGPEEFDRAYEHGAALSADDLVRLVAEH
jgi:predicted ATPase